MQAAIANTALKSLAPMRRFRCSEEGQDLLEYGLLASLIALVAFGAVASVGNTINSVFWTMIAVNF
jgi:Flp pilus assembly pilin Flp